MGKSKRKDKRHKTTVDENEEKRKMRDSILKVFQARVQSPGGGGAVLVNDKSSSGKTKAFNRSKCLVQSHKLHDARGSSTLSSSESEAEGSTNSQREARKRKRFRKTAKGNEADEFDVKAGVGHHIQAAHSFSYARSTDSVKHRETHKTDRMGCITRSRLTRNLGLFNPGKKSSTVMRHPIPVPASVERDVDRTLRQILHQDEDHKIREQDTSACISHESHYTSGHSPHHYRHNSASSTPASASRDSGKGGSQRGSHHRSPLSTSPHVTSGKSDSDQLSSTDLEHIFPKIPPIHDIAKGMVSELETQCRKNFKNRDLLAETCVELKKLLRQNQRTPEAASSSYHAAGSCSARRSLIGSFSILAEDHPPQRPHSAEVRSSLDVSSPGSALRLSTSHPHRHSMHSLSQGSAPLATSHPSNPLESVLSLCPRKQNCASAETSRIPREGTDDGRESGDMEMHPCMASTSNLGIGDSAISLLQCNAMISKISALCGTQERSQFPPKEPHQLDMGNSHILHQKQSQFVRSPSTQVYRPRECFSSGLVNRDVPRTHADSFLDKVMGSSSANSTASQNLFRSIDHKQDQQQVPQCTGYDRHHDDYYCSQWRLSDVLMGGLSRPETDSHYSCHSDQKPEQYPSAGRVLESRAPVVDYQQHDMLDQLDFNPDMGVDPQTWASRKRHHGDCCMADALDQECGVWEWEAPNELPPLRKPSLDTPSPPDKLSPHRLY